MKLNEPIIQFFKNQGYVIVSTIDSKGFPHTACKGIVKIEPRGRVYLLDLYNGRTYENLKNNPYISISSIDEHKFSGYSLKGKAAIIPEERLHSGIFKDWEERIASRITQRLLKNIKEEKGHPRHPEVLLPRPKYMILMEVQEVVDLTPRHLK